MKNVAKVVAVLLVAGLFFGGMTLTAVAQELKAQETCPIMGGKINKAQFIDVAGSRIYVCCPGCFGKIKEDPAAAIAKLKELGEKPEPAPATQVKELKLQETCPLMDKPINKDIFTDFAGYRIYSCCAHCNEKVEADPAAAIAALKERGEKPAPAPAAQDQEQENENENGLKAQETCPLMADKPIDKAVFVDVNGSRIYSCCAGCNDKIKADPEAAIAALKERGETVAALPVWDNDFEYVKKLSATNKKPILVNMTGSDWCVWCVRLKDEVFSKKEFKDFATAKLNLFYADFPRNKKLPEAEVAQNAALRDKFSKMKDAEGKPMFSGYPTIFLLNAKGEILAKTGYKAGGPVKYVEHLKELIVKAKKGEKYDEGFILPDIEPTNGETMECEGCSGDMDEVKVDKKVEKVEKVKK